MRHAAQLIQTNVTHVCLGMYLTTLHLPVFQQFNAQTVHVTVLMAIKLVRTHVFNVYQDLIVQDATQIKILYVTLVLMASTSIQTAHVLSVLQVAKLVRIHRTAYHAFWGIRSLIS